MKPIKPIDDWKLYSPATGEEYPVNTPVWKSDRGAMLDIQSPKFTEIIASEIPGMWSFANNIPVFDSNAIISFHEGMTPVVSQRIGEQDCLLKLDYLFPTGSYKDRGASVLISKVKELGIKRVVEDSSGNAGCAIAAYAARAGIQADIVVSSSTSPAKIQQLKAYGANVIMVEGNRQAVADAALEMSQTVYYASHVWNPFFFQGTKTFAYEVWKQCASAIPGSIVMPVGNGTLLIGCYLGFKELKAIGLIDRIPKLVAVQATNCAPLASGKVLGATIAEGIAVENPRRKEQILQIIRDTGGEVITVDEAEISVAWTEAALRGFYIEKTSAAGWAGMKKWKDSSISLLVLTGHGLKNAGF